MAEEREPSKSDSNELRSRDREEYLAKLRARAKTREETKAKEQQALKLKAEHAARSAQTYLDKLSRRKQFRAAIKQKMLADWKSNEELMRRLGQLYRRQLKWYIGRDLTLSPDDEIQE